MLYEKLKALLRFSEAVDFHEAFLYNHIIKHTIE